MLVDSVKKLLFLGMTITIVLGLSHSANALEFTLQSITINDFDETDGNLGLDIFTDSGPYLAYSTRDLSVGERQKFALFDIWTDEHHVGSDDKVAKSISVGFSFSAPKASGGHTYGKTVGVAFFGFFLPHGELTWTNDPVFTFGNGGMFSVELSDTWFNTGLFRLKADRGNGATVWATLTYTQAPDGASAKPIPEPATLLLVGAGLIGLAGFGRKKYFKD